MWTRKLFDSLTIGRSRPCTPRGRREQPNRRSAGCRLAVESLEDRSVPATLSIGDATVIEGVGGTQNAAIRVTLSEPLKRPVTVDYRTADYTAVAGSDYAATSGKLNFAKGETVKTILVPVYGDLRPENSEAFYVRLWGNKGATIADGLGVVTIVDPTPRLTVSTEYGYEGSVMTFTVSLSSALNTALTVNFTTADGSPYADQFDSAYAGQDYIATSGTLTFAPGELTKTITVEILDDGVEEYDEYFFVLLSGASAPVLIMSDGWGMIYGEWWV